MFVKGVGLMQKVQNAKIKWKYDFYEYTLLFAFICSVAGVYISPYLVHLRRQWLKLVEVKVSDIRELWVNSVKLHWKFGRIFQ